MPAAACRPLPLRAGPGRRRQGSQVRPLQGSPLRFVRRQRGALPGVPLPRCGALEWNAWQGFCGSKGWGVEHVLGLAAPPGLATPPHPPPPAPPPPPLARRLQSEPEERAVRAGEGRRRRRQRGGFGAPPWRARHPSEALRSNARGAAVWAYSNWHDRPLAAPQPAQPSRTHPRQGRLVILIAPSPRAPCPPVAAPVLLVPTLWAATRHARGGTPGTRRSARTASTSSSPTSAAVL